MRTPSFLLALASVVAGVAPAGATDPCDPISTGIYDPYTEWGFDEPPLPLTGPTAIKFWVYLHLDVYTGCGPLTDDCHHVALTNAIDDPNMPPYPDGIFRFDLQNDPRLCVAYVACFDEDALDEWIAILDWIEGEPTGSVGANWAWYTDCSCACAVGFTYNCF